MSIKIIFVEISFVFISISGMAQNKSFTQKIERIEDTLYLINNEERFKVDTETVTVKLKSTEMELGTDYKIIRSNRLGYIDIKVPEGIDVERYVYKLKQTEKFESVEYNSEAICCLTPNDYYSSIQWHINSIYLKDAWDITTGSQNVKVAIIDTGVEASHYDLGYGYDGYSHVSTLSGVNYTTVTDAHIYPMFYHGTFVAGVLGAKTNNTIGIAGVSGGNHSEGVKIIPYCVGNSASFNTSSIDDAILDAIDKGVKVINISLQLLPSTSIDAAIEDAYANNVTIVCASGNNYPYYVSYPASHEKTIAVGAINANNNRASFSHYGTGLDFVAPGENIYSTTLENSYDTSSGTSFAAPQVAGVAALMLSINPTLTPDQIRSIIRSTCTKLSGYTYNNSGWNSEVGYGLLNAFSAVYFSNTHSIVGPSCIYNGSGSYYIDNLPNGVTVEWSLSDSYYNQNCLQQNTPSQNHCTISCSNTQDMTGAILTATIKHNGATIDTLTMNNLCAYQGFKGTYSSSMGSGQYISPNPIFTGANTLVHISSPRLVGATVTYTGDATPSYWNLGNNTIDARMPSSGSTILIHVICEAGDDYYIPIIKTPNKLALDIDGEVITITPDDSIIDNQDWTLEIYNVANGENMVTKNVSGNSVSLDTSGWKRGLYIARAIIGKEVLTGKIQVN